MPGTLQMEKTDPKSATVYLSEKDFKKRFDFDTEQALGEGGFAKVYKAYDRQFDEFVALKFQFSDKVSKYDLLSEVKRGRKLSHKNIVRVHEAYVIKMGDSSFGPSEVQVGVLEYAEGGNLYDYIKKSDSEKEFREIFCGILDGLHFLHTEKQLVHRDLSSDNVLIFHEGEKAVPKLADFGISKDLRPANASQKKSTQLVGKVEFMAPEQFSPEKFGINGKIGTNVDLWAFGVILYEAFMNKTPFTGGPSDNPMTVMHNICHKPLPNDLDQIPQPYREVVKKCLVKHASQRLRSAEDVKNLLLAHKVLPKPKKSIRNAVVAVGMILVLTLAIWGTISVFRDKESQMTNKSTATTEEMATRRLSVEEQLEAFFNQLTDNKIPYEERKKLINEVIASCFTGEEARVERLINDTPIEMRNIRDFLNNALAKGVTTIHVVSNEKDRQGKIDYLSVTVE